MSAFSAQKMWYGSVAKCQCWFWEWFVTLLLLLHGPAERTMHRIRTMLIFHILAMITVWCHYCASRHGNGVVGPAACRCPVPYYPVLLLWLQLGFVWAQGPSGMVPPQPSSPGPATGQLLVSQYSSTSPGPTCNGTDTSSVSLGFTGTQCGPVAGSVCPATYCCASDAAFGANQGVGLCSRDALTCRVRI